MNAPNSLRFAGCIALVTILVACATPKDNYQPTEERFSIPAIGAESEAFVGDEMLSVGVKSDYDVLVIDSTQEISLYEAHPGVFLPRGSDQEYTYFFAPTTALRQGAGYVSEAWIADPVDALAVNRGRTELCAVTVFTAIVCNDDAYFSIEKRSGFSEDAFQQTLIYSGRIEDRVRISYREFYGDTARPAFSNDVDYDLSESNLISYKGARIEILSADNSSIRYRVLSNFRS